MAEFGDIYGLDDEVRSFVSHLECSRLTVGDLQLLTLVPQPVKAVILLFPISAGTEAKRKEEDEKIEKDGQHAIDPQVLWIKQTVC